MNVAETNIGLSVTQEIKEYKSSIFNLFDTPGLELKGDQ